MKMKEMKVMSVVVPGIQPSSLFIFRLSDRREWSTVKDKMDGYLND